MKENRYTMPQQFMDDANVALKWKLYGYLNGFWLAGKPVYARNDTIAKLFNKSERAVQSALEELEEIGLITRDIKGLSRYILPGGIKQEGRSPASPLHEAQLHQGDEAQLHHISDSISDSLISVADAPQIVEVRESEESERVPKSQAKYKNARIAFSWFPSPEKSWYDNTTELKCGNLLFERGEAKVRSALAYVKAHQDDDFFYSITSPSELERKWVKLVNHK